jgi:hypothetical protein
MLNSIRKREIVLNNHFKPYWSGFRTKTTDEIKGKG